MLQKEQYYWTQLRRALQEGQWLNQFPSRAPNGTLLPWPELFRKFNKHCKGFQDIAEIASQTQSLAAFLAINSADEDQDDATEAIYPLDLGNECVLPEERIEEMTAGYEVLKELQSSHMDTLSFALAYYAYALGNPTKCLSHLGDVPDLLHLQNHIPLEPGSEPSTQSSASTLHVPVFGTGSTLASTTGTFASIADSSAPEIKDGRAWALTETVRSLCLQGMSYEKLTPSHPQQALKSYGAALPLFYTITNEVAATAAPNSSNNASFTQLRELWRWVERLLWRAIILASRIGDVHEQGLGSPTSVWTWFKKYGACCVYWPPTFRTGHRSTISSLYLRAFILRYGQVSRGSTTVGEGSHKSPAWLGTARSVVNDYRAVLNVSTSFPRAGERNVKVEDFVDLCVGVWEASGAVGDSAGWVIDVLWWATRLTFNSHRILRHMTRLFYVSGDPSLARRTLLLYMQVVGKMFQASGGVRNEDTDTDAGWVETLVSGARMLCKTASSLPGTEGMDEVKEARTCIDRARMRLDKDDKRLVASVDLAEGVWNSVMALKEQDPLTRSKRFEDAHAHLLRSVDNHPIPAAHFHLALSYTRPGPLRDMTQAIENAGMAVEGHAKEIRYWHLLGLLLAAEERWSDAAEILERGAELGEEVEVEEAEGSKEGDGSVEKDEGIANGDASSADTAGMNGLAVPEGEDLGEETPRASSLNKGRNNVSLLDPEATEIPEPSCLLLTLEDHLPLSRLDVFEQALQLRMTQGALTEVVEGPEGAEVKWLETFLWVAEKRSQTEGTPRASIDGSRPSKEASFVNVVPSPEKTSEDVKAIEAPSVEVEEKAAVIAIDTLVPPPPPITVSPATPDLEGVLERASTEKKRHGGLKTKRSTSIDREGSSKSVDRDTSKSKKMQQMLKHGVHRGHVRITSISRKIGHGVVRNGGGLKRTLSAPDFHAILRQTSYQASSIHSRRRVSSIMHSQYSQQDEESEAPPPAPSPIPPPPHEERERKRNRGLTRSNRLIADLWLMSAATFRRLGKIEQAKGSIQEAEVRDEGNPGVWVQLGLYHMALNKRQNAISAFQKALLISPDDVAASVHLARVYLEVRASPNEDEPRQVEVDLAAGILSHLTRGIAWDVPEAWYFLAKAYGAQGRKGRERESLERALGLSEKRGVRDIGSAIGWCL